MKSEEPEGETYGPTADLEQITAEFPVYPGPYDEVIVDDVPGRPEDALVDVKRRIQETIESAGRP